MHRIGRACRYGTKESMLRNGVAINFITPNDVKFLNEIQDDYKIEINNLPNNLDEIEIKALNCKELQIKMIKEGEGELCHTGALITAHYHGTLMNGTVFDSSIQRNQPFEAVIGVGQLIRGWDETFVKMKKGGKAEIICPPEYAYGAQGVP